MAQPDIESVLNEQRVFAPPAEFSQRAHIASPAEFDRLTRLAEANPEQFWSDIARDLDWFSPWQSVLEWKPPFAKWFGFAPISDGTLRFRSRCNVIRSECRSPLLSS